MLMKKKRDAVHGIVNVIICSLVGGLLLKLCVTTCVLLCGRNVSLWRRMR